MEKLNKVIKQINSNISIKLPEINSGGCGVFALRMHNELKKLGYDSEIMIITRRTESICFKKEVLNDVLNRKRVNSNDKQSTSFAHCCIKVGDVLFDGKTEGRKLIDDWIGVGRFSFGGTYTAKELKTALRIGGWNSTYNRKKNPIMYRVIDKAIKQHLK